MIPAFTIVGGGSYQDYIVASGTATIAGPDVAPRLTAFPFSYDTGFGTEYTTPVGLQSSGTNGGKCAFGESSAVAGIAYGPSSGSTGTMNTWPFSGAGWGTKYSQPTTAPTMSSGAAYNHMVSPGLVGVGGGTSPYINVYAFSNTTGYGTRYSNPGTLPSTVVQMISFRTQATTALAGCWQTTSPYVRVWQWASGFSTAYAAPATLPTGTTNSIRFNSAGDTVLISMNASPYVAAYSWTSGSGWGTRYTPTTLPTGSATDASWRPGDNAIAVSHSTTPFLSVYPWTGSFGSKYADPATTPGSAPGSTNWNYDGSVLLCQTGSSTLQAYKWASGFSTKYTNATASVPIGTYATFNNQLI